MVIGSYSTVQCSKELNMDRAMGLLSPLGGEADSGRGGGGGYGFWLRFAS
jgi:hypothetical protein